MPNQLPRNIEVVLGRREVERGLAIGALRVHLGLFLEEEIDGLLAFVVFQAAGDHERGPARAVGDFGVEVAAVEEGARDVEVVVGDGPVDGETVVVVFLGGELGVGLQV